MRSLLVILFIALQSSSLLADKTSFENSEKIQIRQTVNEVLNKYCESDCKLLGIQLEVYEEVEAREDLGFEAIDSTADTISYYVNRAQVTIQIDSKISEENKQRLEKLIALKFKPMGTNTEVVWEAVDIPNINKQSEPNKRLESSLRRKLSKRVNSVFQKYCPDSCLLEKIDIESEVLGVNKQNGVDKNNLYFEGIKKEALKVENIFINVTMDEKIPERQREQIETILASKTNFIEPVNYNVNITLFPESYFDKQKRLEDAKDPYGLEKLKRTLTLFRELAGTKEIITSSDRMLSSSLSTTSEKIRKAPLIVVRITQVKILLQAKIKNHKVLLQIQRRIIF